MSLVLEKLLNTDNFKRLKVAKLPMRHYSVTCLEQFDFATQREFDDEYTEIECSVIDFQDFNIQETDSLSSPFIDLFWSMTQSAIKLQSSLGEFSEQYTIEYDYVMELIQLTERSLINTQIVEEAKRTYQYSKTYFDKVTASVIPLLNAAPISQPHLN